MKLPIANAKNGLGSANEVRIPAHHFPTANQVHNVEVTLKVENDSGGHKRVEKIQMRPTPNDNLVTGIQVGNGLDGSGETLYGFHDNDDYTMYVKSQNASDTITVDQAILAVTIQPTNNP